MTKVGVARLKAQFGRYLEAARRGEEVVITERGRPVAKLVAAWTSGRAESRRDHLARTGVLVLGKPRRRSLLSRPLRGKPELGEGVLRALLEERATGR
jgi:prevent-host-death family protein